MRRIWKFIWTGVGVALVALAIIYIATHFEEISRILPLDKIKDFFLTLWDKLCAFIDKIWYHIKNW